MNYVSNPKHGRFLEKSNITVAEYNLPHEGKKLNSSRNELVPTKIQPIQTPEVLENTSHNSIYVYNANMIQYLSQRISLASTFYVRLYNNWLSVKSNNVIRKTNTRH